MAERTVILHYHLFKNAGTSFDAVLKRNFPGQWAQAEFPGPGNPARVQAWIAENPGTVAFSTHTGRGPLPELPGVRVISALFLRDPVERIRSVYRFERRQGTGAEAPSLGAKLAASLDFEGYVRARLAMPGDRQCRNFQVERLASFVRQSLPELRRAKLAVPRLSFLGQVERFDDSMARFARLAQTAWPDFDPGPVHLNQTGDDDVLPESAELSALLEEYNALDRKLIQFVRNSVWKR